MDEPDKDLLKSVLENLRRGVWPGYDVTLALRNDHHSTRAYLVWYEGDRDALAALNYLLLDEHFSETIIRSDKDSEGNDMLPAKYWLIKILEIYLERI